MKKRFVKSLVVLVTLICGLVFVCAACKKNQADTSTSGAEVSLTSFEGTVYLEDASGNRKEIAAGDVIGSGDILITGEGGKATVTLAKDRTAYMDENTKLQFVREGNSLDLFVSEGRILMDVKEKLKENETLTVHTTAITADIRGTIVFVQELPQQTGPSDSLFGVLEGSADVSYTGLNNPPAQIQAGWQTDAQYQNKQEDIQITKVTDTQINQEDLGGFFGGIIQDHDLQSRITVGSEISADSDATYSGEVTIVAQSATKLYDGKPLAVPSDVLVYGLPDGYKVNATANGSQTNAGSSANLISGYTILNVQGEDVTSRFINVKKVSGVLKVDRAPITIWTGSSEKEYDGQPLTNEEAGVLAGHVVNDSNNGEIPAQTNSVCEMEDAAGQKEIVGLNGNTQVYVTDPLTGESRTTTLRAGQKLTIDLSNGENAGNLAFTTSNISETDIPEAVLRVYAANPEMLAQACLDAGWDPDLMNALIAALPQETDSQNYQGLLSGSVNAQITIDPENTGTVGCSLSGEEVSFTPITIDSSIKVTATGSQTAVGESINTYSIDWGSADLNNYIVTEELGKLVVTKKGSSNNTPAPSGTGVVPSGYPNNPSGSGNDPSGNQNNPSDNKEEEQEKPITTAVTFESGSASKVYDGTALSNNTVTVTGLPDGYTYQASCSASITDAGSVENTISELKIFDANGKDVTKLFTNVTKTAGTLTVEALQLQVEWETENTMEYAGFSYQAYVGDVTVTYLNGSHTGESMTKTADESAEGESDQTPYLFTLYTGDQITVYASGEGCDAGTYPVTLVAQAPTEKTADYTFTCSEASFTINTVELIVNTKSAEKKYDGEPLTAPGVTISRDFNGEVLPISSDGTITYGEKTITFTATGSITSKGTTSNTYSVDWGTISSSNFTLKENLGTLKVTDGLPDVSYVVYGAVLNREQMKAAFPELKETYDLVDCNYADAWRCVDRSVYGVEYSTADYQALVKDTLNTNGFLSEEIVEDGTIGGVIPETSCDQIFDPEAASSDSINFITVGGAVISQEYMKATFPATGKTVQLRNASYSQIVEMALALAGQSYESDKEYQESLYSLLASNGWSY
ncbi:MAG: FecR domain-containing protein [Lachnospiraceae bacterium]|nr:FecR domain-containing protein [Lachnospiraceae bacterium]